MTGSIWKVPPPDHRWRPSTFSPVFAAIPLRGSAPEVVVTEERDQLRQAAVIHEADPRERVYATMAAVLRDIGVPDHDIRSHSATHAEAFALQREPVGVAALRLPNRSIALLEVVGIPTEREGRYHLAVLRDRMLAAAQAVRPLPATDRAVRVLAVVATAMLFIGIVTISRADALRWTIFAGGLLTFFTVVLAALGALQWAGRTGARSLGERLTALWDNPNALRKSSQLLWVPLMAAGVVFWTRNPDGILQPFLYWSSLLGGLVLSFFGARHDLLRQLLALRARRAAAPASVTPGGWTEVPASSLPDHVARPGRIDTAFRYGVEDTWGVIFRQDAEPAWARWNQQVHEWDSPRGKVTARSYNTWDRRVETTVEAHTAGWTARVETGSDVGRAVELTKELTGLLPVVEESERPRAQLTGFLTYSFLPIAGMLILSGILWVTAIAQVPMSFPLTLASIRVSAWTFLLVPVYLLVMSTLVHLRGEWFRFDRRTLRRRARRAYGWTVLGVILNLVFLVLWSERYWTDWFRRGVLWAVPILMLLVIPAINRRMWRGSMK